MSRILISAGHTMMDPGDTYADLREADLTRKISGKVIEHLKNKGQNVTSVPLDLPLMQRIDWINNTGYQDSQDDVCVEIHINKGGKRGLEGWYREQGGNKSQQLVETLLTEISKETGYANQGGHSEYDHELGGLSFLSRTRPTSAIIECLYIDQPDDIAILKNDQKLDDLAKSIANAVVKYTEQAKQKADQAAKQAPAPAPMPTQSSFPAPAPAPMSPAPINAFANSMQPNTGFNPPPTNRFANPAVGAQPAPSFNPAGGFGGLGGGGGAGGGFGGGMGAAGGGFGGGGGMGGGNLMQDREQRKEVIRKRYIQILGREPSQNDTNYFLNMGTTEDQLIRKMIDSQEHVDLVKAKQELAKLKDEYEKIKNDLLLFKNKAQESEQMLHNLNLLLQEKNQQLIHLQQQANSRLATGQYAPFSGAPAAHAVPKQDFKPKEGIMKKITRLVQD